jgi:hypothetical protein
MKTQITHKHIITEQPTTGQVWIGVCEPVQPKGKGSSI